MAQHKALRHGQIYHIYNRGVNREDLFKEERNYDHFLNLLLRHVHPVADIYAYCLLRNHFHILLRIRMRPEIKRSAARMMRSVPPGQFFGNFFNAYAKAVNSAYSRTGCLFEKPFKRKVVSTADYFRQLVVYIHRNPQKHGLVSDFTQWPYSSFGRFAEGSDPVIELSTVVSSFGNLGGFRGAHYDESTFPGDRNFGDFA